MTGTFNGIILFYLGFTFVKCIIPNLSVQKLNSKLIARKRLDTLEMCRIFTSENNIELSKDNTAMTKENWPDKGNIRSKRDTQTIKLGNPAISAESIQRIENIVNKLYQDIGDQKEGERVTYMTRMTTIKDELNKTMRRFNFAPAELLGPGPTTESQLFHDNNNPPGIPWPKRWKHGIVPYFIDSKTYDSQLIDTIVKAFDYFEKATCIRLQKLRDRPTDKESLQKVEWLYITNPAGIRQCVHSNEKKANKGVQMVVFGYDCLSLGEIVHEVLHILGFSHEHTRPDRDQYITILWKNIKPGYKKYFELRKDDPLMSIPYDYSSVLHYPPRAFSKNGQITIMGQDGARVGQRGGLSEADVEKVGLVYGNECVDRNRQYLLKTCPSVVKSSRQSENISKSEIFSYFKGRIWPYGIVNYKLKDKMEFSTEERENIKAVINHIEKETCIRFRDLSQDEEANDNDNDNQQDNETPLTKNVTYHSDNIKDESQNEIKKSDDDKEQQTKSGNETTNRPRKMISKEKNKIKSGTSTKSYRESRRHAESTLTFTRSPEPGCSCPLPGKPEGNKILKINADCFNSVNDLLHLFIHLLGLDHQHNMYDRDAYLHILWDNLSPEVSMEMKNKLPPAASVGFDYDYQSVMHYPWLQIKNGVTNLMYPIWNDGWAMGHWQGLSSIDVQKLNLLYYRECLQRQREVRN